MVTKPVSLEISVILGAQRYGVELSKGWQGLVHAFFSPWQPLWLLSSWAHYSHPEPREPLQPPPSPTKLQGPQLLAFVCWLVGKFFTSEAESYTKHR